MTSAAMITDSTGAEVEIEDQLKTVKTVPPNGVEFSNTW